MASVGNSTCARFDNVARSGGLYQQEAPFLFVKGTWLPSEFTISVCDGNDAWTGRATKDFVLNNASQLAMTESEYVDSIQYYFSKQQPNARYELKWGKNSSPQLLCSKILPHELILRLETIADSGPGVAADMVQFLLDAHHRLNEELARKTRAYEREVAAKELALTSLKKQLDEGKGSPKDHTNGHVHVEPDAGLKPVGGTSSRGKRKAGAETGSRKRTAQGVKASEALPLFQKPPSPIRPLLDSFEEQVLATRPPPLSQLGYKQLKAGEERETSKDPSWLEHVEGKDNGVTDDSNSDGQPLGARKAFLDRLSDVAVAGKHNEDVAPVAKKGSGKKQGKSGGKSGVKSSKKPRPKPSLEDSLDQVEDVVEKGIKSVDSIVLEVTSPLATPVKQQRKAPATAKKLPKSSVKAKKQASSRSSRKKAKPVVVDSEPEASEEEPKPSESPEPVFLPGSRVDENRAISVQNAEFHDFDESRTEAAFAVGQFWALYDDQDGMPRFYSRVTGIQDEPFQVSVEWLEPYKPNLPANGLVKTANLSASCGEFTFGSGCSQDLPAFSHIVEVEIDSQKALIRFFPEKDEIWALYRQWDKKQAKKEDGDEEFYYEYDLVKVQSKLSTTEGLAVVPLVKVAGFKSLFTVGDQELTYCIPYKEIQARFSHSIPKQEMLGSESPGVPVGAWELDPASTPSEYLGSVAKEGVVDNSK